MFGYVPNEHDDPEVAGEGWWYVYGRSDNRVFIPKANCAFNAGKNYWPNKKICPSSSEKVNGIWRAPFSALPLVQQTILLQDHKASSFGLQAVRLVM